MQTLNLKQLEAFCAVVERGSFTAAAEALYLAQSTVSGHILALEKDIGVPLLVRSGKRRITLTEEGRRVYERSLRFVMLLAFETLYPQASSHFRQ